MTVYLSQRELVTLALAGEPGEGALAVAAALDPGSAELAPGDPVLAGDLVRTYQVRLRRWQETGIPRSVGLPGIVAALEALGGEPVLLVHLAVDQATVLALLRPDRSELLAAAVLHH